jgi:hypothetical protein
MIKDDILSFFDNYPILTIHSIKLEHHFNAVATPNKEPFRETMVFHKNEGFPMKLNLDSFIAVTIRCKHDVLNVFRIPIETAIEWKIVNGITDGAFKHGYGLFPEYIDKDRGNSVIFYPSNKRMEKGNLPKEIPILVKVKVTKDKLNNLTKGLLINESDDVNYSSLCNFTTDDHGKLILTLKMGKKKGFLNKMFYDVSIICESINGASGTKIPIISAKETGENNTDYKQRYTSYDKDGETIFVIFDNSEQKCATCDLKMTFEPMSKKSKQNKSDHKINIDTGRFFTSECMKISTIQPNITNSCDVAWNQISFEIKDKKKNLGKFIILGCSPIRTSLIKWDSTAGLFPCGNYGSSIIYCSPEEKDLSKSPFIISLYEKNIFTNTSGEKTVNLLDQKKIWLLRRLVLGG